MSIRVWPHVAWLLWAGFALAQGAPVEPDLGTLQLRIQHRLERLERLRKDADFVTSVDKSLKRHDHDGAMTWDVLLVETQAGRMALKVYKSEHSEDGLAMSLVLNEYLGEFGMAPRLHGYLPQSQVAEILGAPMESENGTTPFSFGILMEVIEGAWNFKRDAFIYVPPQLDSWDQEAMIERLRLFWRTLDRLRIKANDTQYFVSGDGQVYLADFDHFNWISLENELWGYAAAFTIQADDFARMKAKSGDQPIPVSNDDIEFDIAFLQQIFTTPR